MPHRLELLANVGLLVAMLAMAAVVILLVVHRTAFVGYAGAPSFRVLLLRALPATTAAIVVLALLAISNAHQEGGAGDPSAFRLVEFAGRPSTGGAILDDRDPEARPGEPDAAEVGPVADPQPATPLPRIALVAVVALLVGAFGWLWRSHRRRRTGLLDDPSASGAVEGVVRDVVVDTIDAMLADRDPRTAIIGAYARLLEGLAARGIERRGYEGPMEHLRRVLTVVRVRPEPLHRLLELFGEARFSDHRLGPVHRDRAIGALRTIAEELGDGRMSFAGSERSPPEHAPP